MGLIESVGQGLTNPESHQLRARIVSVAGCAGGSSKRDLGWPARYHAAGLTAPALEPVRQVPYTGALAPRPLHIA